MTALEVSATVLRDDVLLPTLDAQGCNAVQDRLVYDPSPELDSAVELALELARLYRLPSAAIHPLLEVLARLHDANRAEREHERHVAGVTDALAIERHRNELAGTAPGVKALARRLRGPLGAVDLDVLAASHEIDEVVESVPPGRLASASLRNELGPGKHDLLVAWASYRQRSRAI